MLFSAKSGRVETWRGGDRIGESLFPHVVRGASFQAIAPSPRPAHRTGRADFPHPALGQGIMLSPTGSGAQATAGAPGRGARPGSDPGSVCTRRWTPCACRTATGGVSLACSAVCSFRTVWGVVRFTPISRSCTTSCARLELRPLPSTGITRLRRYYEPLRHPIRPGSGPRGSPVGGHAPPPGGASRVALGLHVHACRRHYPGGAAGRRRSSCPAVSAFPESHRSASTSVFSRLAQRLLTLRPACSPGRHATLSTGGFSSFVASTTAPIATGWSDSCQAGISPAENQRLFTAHGTPYLLHHMHRPSAGFPGLQRAVEQALKALDERLAAQRPASPLVGLGKLGRRAPGSTWNDVGGRRSSCSVT